MAENFMSFIFLLILESVFHSTVCGKSYIRGCYYTNWAQYRDGKAKFLPENYETGLCTHIFYAFAKMNSTFQIQPYEYNDLSTPTSKGMYEKVKDLKKLQPELKVLLSFAGGGFSFSDEGKRLLKQMASTTEGRRKFAKSALQYVKSIEYDGFDMDWEFPEADDKKNFALLLKEMSNIFHQNDLLLTAAVSANRMITDLGYDVPSLAKSLDFINLMTYDFHGTWNHFTGHNSPLHDHQGDELSVSSSALFWKSKGFPKNRIIIGFPTYGRSWTLRDRRNTSIGAPADVGRPGPFTKSGGTLAYFEVCNIINSGGAVKYDEEQKAYYVIKDDQWISYDDEYSYKLKIEWLKNNNFGGAFVWSLDTDDFNNICSTTRRHYVLIKTIKDSLHGGPSETHASRSKTTPLAKLKPVRIIPARTSRPMEPHAEFTCSGEGLYPDATSCSNFYSCGASMIPYKMKCGDNLHFNPRLKVCDWPANAGCSAGRIE